MLGHGEPTRSVVAHTSQMFAETTPKVSSSLTNVKKCAGYAIDKILGLAGEMVTDGKGRFEASYLSDETYATAGVASRTLTRAGTSLLDGRVIRSMDRHVS